MLVSMLTVGLLSCIVLSPVHAGNAKKIVEINGVSPEILRVQAYNNAGVLTPVTLSTLAEFDLNGALYTQPPIDQDTEQPVADPVLLRQVPTRLLVVGPEGATSEWVTIDQPISSDNTTAGYVYPGKPDPITLDDYLDVTESTMTIKKFVMNFTKLKLNSRA